MLHRLYTFFIEPRQKDEDLRNREYVLNTLSAGTGILMLCGIIALAINYCVLEHHYVLGQMAGIGVAFLAVCAVFALSRSGRHLFAARLLVAIYLVLASSVAWNWGVILPSAVLLFALVIMVTGTILPAPYPLFVAAISTAIVVAIGGAQANGTIQPDLHWMDEPFEQSTIVGFCMIFAIIALISWLFYKRTEQSLHRALRAEANLTKQKALLETTVEKRTQELQAVQLEKIQQMYRFAELGQLSTALLHDLANHLTTLTLDIENLEDKTRSRMLSRAKRSIRYIDEMVIRVRDQLHGRSQVRPFAVNTEINEIVGMLNHRAWAAGVTLKWQSSTDKKLRCRGDKIRFRQLIANLLSNAIDAYDDKGSYSKREVHITAEAEATSVIITVHDWGKGIDKPAREKLFQAFYSTKRTGMGMGLFISKQIVEEHFLGTIHIDESKKHTAFVVTLPKAGS
jgi:signal transduction histidine kinase